MTADTADATRSNGRGAFVPSERMRTLFQELGAATTDVASGLDRERADLLQSLRSARVFLKHTLRGVTDEQARRRSTVSELCLGGLIKHVTGTESQWARFLEIGPQAMAGVQADVQQWADGFRMDDDETVADLLDRYDAVADRTDALVASLPDLDAEQPLPPAPWFPAGARWSARRVVLHLLAETAQHAGHADILRESLDGAKTMG